jgi:hypothetical protein
LLVLVIHGMAGFMPYGGCQIHQQKHKETQSLLSVIIRIM